MARLRGHRALDFDQPLLVKRGELTICERTIKAGEVLPWRELGLSARKVEQLWAQRRIGHEKPQDRAGAEAISPPPSALPKPAKQPRARS